MILILQIAAGVALAPVLLILICGVIAAVCRGLARFWDLCCY